jgi:hypothetical protein
MYNYFGSTRFLIGKRKSFFWEHSQPKWETIMFASPQFVVMEKMKNEIKIIYILFSIFIQGATIGNKLIMAQSDLLY